MQKLILNNCQETIIFAKKLASTLTSGSILTFTGELGAGKTIICREIIKHICGEQVVVSSPTFNIVQIYKAALYKIYHLDLYRLKNSNELYELGVEDAWNSDVCLIEWPEIIESIIPKPYTSVTINVLSQDQRLCIVDQVS